MSAAGGLHFFQFSISTLDVARSRDWYASMFGLLPSGGMEPAKVVADLYPGGGRRTSNMGELQGIPGAQLDHVLWLVDRRDFFQLELFEYSAPTVEARPAGWRACDIGYSSVGIHVSDFDVVVARLTEHPVPFVGPVIGEPERRRICVEDPDGVLVEVMEDEARTPLFAPAARPEVPAEARSARLSVPDLDRARRFWVDTLGLAEAEPTELHGPEHEALWGLDGADRDVALLHAGDYWVELVQYRNPVGRPWPDGYVISDQGIFNVGLASRDRSAYLAVRTAVEDGGYVVHPTHSFDGLDVTYLVDDQGFSVQLNHNSRAHDVRLGFVPPEA